MIGVVVAPIMGHPYLTNAHMRVETH
jgi:hypothetical protein